MQHITLLSRPPVFLPTQSVKTQPAGRLGKARFNSLSHQHNIVQVANPQPSHCSARIHARLQQGALSFDGNGEDSRKTAVRKKIDCTDLSGRVRAQRAAIWHTARLGSLVIRLQRAPRRGRKIAECTFPCNRRKHSITLL